MSVVCNPGCLDDAQISTYPVPCDRIQALRKGGAEIFILLDCDQVLTDITDEAEWLALKEDCKLIVSPEGFAEYAKPETTKQQLSACREEEVTKEVSKLSWYTLQFDNTTFLDFEFEADLKAKARTKTLLWIGCDGLMYYSNSWATGENPGFNIVVDVWRESLPNEVQKLNVEFTFETTQSGLKGFPVTQAILDAIYADCILPS
jgi:hypothetical protein